MKGLDNRRKLFLSRKTEGPEMCEKQEGDGETDDEKSEDTTN